MQKEVAKMMLNEGRMGNEAYANISIIRGIQYDTIAAILEVWEHNVGNS